MIMNMMQKIGSKSILPYASDDAVVFASVNYNLNSTISNGWGTQILFAQSLTPFKRFVACVNTGTSNEAVIFDEADKEYVFGQNSRWSARAKTGTLTDIYNRKFNTISLEIKYNGSSSSVACPYFGTLIYEN